MAFARPVPSRKSLANALVTAMVLITALITVGLTASANSPFSITIRPVIMRLGVDVDVRIGSVHLHAGWSALPESTKPAADRF